MDLLQALVLGIVQGITEFLPISSTAHLVLVPHLFGWADPGLTFDVALHLGTFLAVAWYFWNDLKEMFWGFTRSISSRDFTDPHQRMPWMIALGTIPAGVAGLLWEDKVETVFRSPLVIAFTLVVLGLLLFAGDRLGRKQRDLGDFLWLDATLIGIAQAVALIPGVSRSGATMTMALLMGASREASARFSFLLGFPIIALSALYKLKDLGPMLGAQWLPFLLGLLASTITGYLCIRFLIQFLQKRGMGVFVAYRVVLGFIVLALFMSGQMTGITHF